MVWLPVLPSRAWEAAAQHEAQRILDARVSHYDDPDAHLAKLYSPIIHLPEGMPAWDVYLVFSPAARWQDQPPAPAYWMHQLGRDAPAELRLDGDRMARVVSGLLGAVGREQSFSPSWGRFASRPPPAVGGLTPHTDAAGGLSPGLAAGQIFFVSRELFGLSRHYTE